MSWSIEEHIGEGRPWPEQVVVYRGETDESLTYARRSLSDVNKMVELMDTLAAENAKLRQQLADATESMGRVGERCAKLREERNMYRDLVGCMVHPDVPDQLAAENAKLRDGAAKMAQWYDEELKAALAENAKLRELVRDMMRFFEDGSYCTTCEKVAECDASEIYECDCLMHSVFTDRMRELGVELP